MKYTYLLLSLIIIACSSPTEKEETTEQTTTEIVVKEVVTKGTTIIKDTSAVIDTIISIDTFANLEFPRDTFKFIQTNDTSLANTYIKRKTPNYGRTSYNWGDYTFSLGFYSSEYDRRNEFSQYCYFLLIKDSVLLDSIPFKGYGTFYMKYHGFINNKLGFPIFSYICGEEVCDSPWYYSHFVLDRINNKMVFMERLETDALSAYQCVFPDDSGGIDNKIILESLWMDDFDSEEWSRDTSFYSFYGDKITRDKQ